MYFYTPISCSRLCISEVPGIVFYLMHWTPVNSLGARDTKQDSKNGAGYLSITCNNKTTVIVVK